ncbi:cellulose synthase-like protein H1 isoform X2 [Macadamia integrifolia]|uniref:cellulose synthase-like protein H1 isoform X2 n=1 Tax=Macadamia integrifolia TaxID=60698 RepID=UPI001C52941C|nr:cellulose synthase-like protein H1 isoform X2 [Macadamia integrifolia]
MATPISSIPFQQRIPARNTLQRVLDLIIFSLLFLLLLYRLQSFNVHGVAWKLAFLCESWFTFVWILNMNAKWTPVDYTTYPERLLQWAGDELPPVDMFVTTADPVLEPPIITVNTVLSLLAVDYPAHKLACYVSDDGSSPLTFYSLVEASKFAKLWVPFCKKYDVQVTAPFMYFSTEPNPSSSSHLSSDFQWEWKKIKNEYEELSQRIEEAAQKPIPCDLTGEFEAFSNIEHGNHPSIIKVIWENKGNFPDGVPHLVYLSREKRPKNQHHYKAGALNVLTRVSGVMTNSPFMLNVDCDMFANNPKIVLMAMCHLLGSEKESESGFVLYPQKFHGASKDDPFGNQLVMLQHVVFRGLAGIQGPLCGGSGCFHRRKVIYGLSPDEAETKARYMSLINGKSPYEALRAKFGNSIELTESAGRVLFVMSENPNHPKDLLSSVKGAISVAACDYESNTQWGKQVSEPAFFVVGSLFVVYNLSTLSEYLRLGLPVRAWWNNQKMARIQSSTAWLFGLLAVILKLLGISETVFTVTRKDQSTPSEGNGDTNSHSGWFTFDESPIFVPATTLLLVHLTALALASLRVQPFQTVHAGWCRPGIGEIICSTWIVLSFLPFLKGLFRRGIYGIRWSILYKSTTLALLFMYFSMLMGSKVQTV